MYAVMLGYSRIPFAAARDGEFFPIFARLHREGFPHVSLLTIGLISVPFCFLSLGDIVNWLLLVEIVRSAPASCCCGTGGGTCRSRS